MQFRRRSTGLILSVLVIVAVAAPAPSAAADDLPLEGALDVAAGRSAISVSLTYEAPAGGQITEFELTLSGPSFDGILIEAREPRRAISWSDEIEDLAPGSYAVTLRAEVQSAGDLLTGMATRTIGVGISDAPPAAPAAAPAPGDVGGVQLDALAEDVLSPDGTVSAQVVVYGGTPSGVLAAVSAARAGATVILIEPSRHVGGMITNGLTATDYGHPSMIGGITDEFFDRMEAMEGSSYGRWRFPPSSAEAVFLQMLGEADVSLITGEAIAEINGVTMDGTRITHLRTTAHRTVLGDAFVDASYEGDLMAAAGVDHRVGRESTAEYGESRAGVRSAASIFMPPLGIEPSVPLIAPGPIGSGDDRIQNSNFRLCFSTDVANQVPFAAPESYDPATYDLPAAYIAWRVARGDSPDITWFLWPVALTRGKFDVNNNGHVSIGVHGSTWAWPQGSYATRAAITGDLRTYTQGFLHFLSADPRVPLEIRQQMAQYGICSDEWSDNGNWPELLYLREGRRMIGEYVLSERDVELTRTKADGIAVASYAFDSHHVSRWIDGAGRLAVEGGFWSGRAAATRWSIPYRSLTPRPGEATNLLVSVAVSITHVAHAAFRLEPQYMLTGEAAGAAAAMAARGIGGPGPVQEVDVSELQSLLRDRGGVIDNYLFWDTSDSPFRGDIERTHLRGITFGCTSIAFCPKNATTREIMAAWLTRALRLPAASRDYFTDDEASQHEDSINRLAEAGITRGCGVGRFCPDGTVTRDQMAAFLVRSFRPASTAMDFFTDDETSIFEGDINRLAASGITAGCGRTKFCPLTVVSREQMSAFLNRATR